MLKSDTKSELMLGSMLMSGLKGMIFGVLLALVLSLVFTAISLAFGDPRAAADLLSYVVLGASSLCVGIVAVRSDSEHRLTSALIGGIMYVLLLFVISLFMSADGTSPILRTIVWMLSIGICLLGGVIGRGRRVRVGEGKNSPTALARRRLAARK